MHHHVDLGQYPLDREGSASWHALVKESRAALRRHGLVSFPGFLRPVSVRTAVAEVQPVLEHSAFDHGRAHNVYFQPRVEGLSPDHPALATCTTVNHTICADQIDGAVVMQLYEWEPLARFLAAVMDKPCLYPMADPLARTNVMSYRAGEMLGWHFDRSEFTTTLLLQAPDDGGSFEYAKDLRSDDDPNYDAVAAVLSGQSDQVVHMPLHAGTLNVFRGRNTAHRVTSVKGAAERIIAVFAYFDRPGVLFSAEERLGFYGRPE